MVATNPCRIDTTLMDWKRERLRSLCTEVTSHTSPAASEEPSRISHSARRSAESKKSQSFLLLRAAPSQIYLLCEAIGCTYNYDGDRTRIECIHQCIKYAIKANPYTMYFMEYIKL